MSARYPDMFIFILKNEGDILTPENGGEIFTRNTG
jgi:hypothetical protein